MFGEKQTIKLTDEKFQDIYTDEKFRNQVATAHWQARSNGERIQQITCSYPITYIVTPEQIAEAEKERVRAKAETIANLKNKLVFVGMGMTYKTDKTDDIGNFRIRTEFFNDKGNQFFVEFMHNCYHGKKTLNDKGEKQIYCDFSIDRTKQIALNDSHYRQGEFYNYNGLEKKGSHLPYTKKGVLEFINKNFDCSFSVVEIDNHNLGTNDFICISPGYTGKKEAR